MTTNKTSQAVEECLRDSIDAGGTSTLISTPVAALLKYKRMEEALEIIAYREPNQDKTAEEALAFDPLA